MGWLSILLIAIGLSVDSFAVCFSKGICIKVFHPWRACKVALVFWSFSGVNAVCRIWLKYWIFLLDTTV
jgi:putative Mn2+ efflux pump MntP